MEKAIFYKEWIKTRWYILISTILTSCFAGYCMLSISRIIRMRGVDHVWQVMIERDAIFIDLLTYLPVLTGLLLALFQFLPEVTQNRLKLTLHLPYPQYRMVGTMLLYGTLMLLACFLCNLLVVDIYLHGKIARELLHRILLTAAPWYVAGLAAYYLAACTCLEPTWKRRVINILLGMGVLRIFFLGQATEAYNLFLPILIVYTLLLSLFSMLSVYRFRTGEQD